MKKRLAHTHFQKRKKKKNIPSSTTSPIQVVKFCSSVVVASNLFASTKIYLLLNQNCKEIAKRKKKTPHHLSLVGVSVLGLVRQILGLGFAWWLNSLSHYSRNPIFFCFLLPFLEKTNQAKSDRYRNTRWCSTAPATVARMLLSYRVLPDLFIYFKIIRWAVPLLRLFLLFFSDSRLWIDTLW